MRISDWSSDVCSSDLFEYVCGTSGKAGNLNGRIVEGGNPHEGRRSKEYPLPPLTTTLSAQLFEKDPREVDRKSVVKGKSVSVSVDLGGRRIITKTNTTRTRIASS